MSSTKNLESSTSNPCEPEVPQKTRIERLVPWAQCSGALLSGVGLVVGSVSLYVAFSVMKIQASVMQIQATKEDRESKSTVDGSQLQVFESARRIADSIYVNPQTCYPSGLAGMQRHLATDRERRQLVALCQKYLEHRDSGGKDSAKVLELAEYLYACGALSAARDAVNSLGELSAFAEKIDSTKLLAMIDCAEGKFKEAKERVKAADEIVDATGDLSATEKDLWHGRVLVVLGTIEVSERGDFGLTPETYVKMRVLAKRFPPSPAASSVVMLFDSLDRRPDPEDGELNDHEIRSSRDRARIAEFIQLLLIVDEAKAMKNLKILRPMLDPHEWKNLWSEDGNEHSFNVFQSPQRELESPPTRRSLASFLRTLFDLDEDVELLNKIRKLRANCSIEQWQQIWGLDPLPAPQP